MIIIRKVNKRYPNGVRALTDINLEIKAREFVYVIGPTGSGKSTLIKLLNTEELPDSGEIIVGKTVVNKIKHRLVYRYRRQIGVVFQDFQLLEKKTVFENVAFALEVLNLDDDATIRVKVREVLQLVGLEEKAKSLPNQLSGGEKQRTAIARAIVNNPQILIADEPTGNLDPKKSEEIMELLEKINRERGTTVIVVTHDQNLVNSKKKRTITLNRGFIVQDDISGGYVG